MSRPYRPEYQPFPQAVKRAALRRAGRQCEACGSSGVPLEVDHAIPQGQGGPSTLENAAVLCRECHGAKTAAEQLQGVRRAAGERGVRRAEHTRYVEPHPNARPRD
jgi:5-methylcytosine-specific restriction endonuclease McrA